MEWASRGLPMPSNASGAATAAGGGTALSGAMSVAASAASEALTTGLAPGIGSVTGASNAAATALNRLSTAATGASMKGGMKGGSVDDYGYIDKMPTRLPGQSQADYMRDRTRYIMNNRGDDFRDLESRGPLYEPLIGPDGRVGSGAGRTPQINRGQRYDSFGLPIAGGAGTTREQYKSQRFDISKKSDAYARLLGYSDTTAGRGADSLWNSPEFLNSAAQDSMTRSQKLMSFLRPKGKRASDLYADTKGGLKSFLPNTGATMKGQALQVKDTLKNSPQALKSFWRGSGGGITGAMPGGGTTGASAAAGGSRVINAGPGSIKDIGLKGKLGYLGGRTLFGQGYKGGTFGTEMKNLVTGKNMRDRYQMSLANQQAVFAKNNPEAAAAGVQMKGSRIKAMKAATKGNLSGLGGLGAMAAGYAASKFGNEENMGALQAGAGMMAVNPLLGIATAGLGSAMSAKTKMGGVASGAAGGAALGMMVGGPLGAAAGALLGATFGFFKAKANQGKMVKDAVKKIHMTQLAGIAAKAVEGALIGTTNLARKKMLDTQKLADAFRGAKTEEERKKVLAEYSKGPNAILTGNTASLAVGDKATATQEQLDANALEQQKLTPMFDRFDGVMKALGGSTQMTSAEIFDLAMRKNVDLYDSTKSLADITKELGIGMAKTAKQMQDAFKDIRIGAQGVYNEYKKGKEIKDSLQGAGNTLRGGNNSAEAMSDYLNKFGDYLDYKNPDSPVANIVATLKAFGSGKAFGTGTYFQTGGVLNGVTQTGEAQGLGADYTSKLKTGAADVLANQFGSQLLGANIQGVDPTMVRNQIAARTKVLIGQVETGSAAGATAEQKTAAATAEAQLKELERFASDPTGFQGKSAGQATDILNRLLYGGSGMTPFGKGALGLENVAKDLIEVKLDRDQLEKDFSAAVTAAFAQSIDAPDWWNNAPNWWNWKFDPATGQFTPPDTRSPRRGRIGDTGAPRALGATMSAHNAMDSRLTGKRTVTSSFRTNNLGSPSSDHAAGRAYDLTGQNLGQYASLAKASGGFAEFHGAASSRHLHVVPSLTPSGDTSSPMSSNMSPTGTTYNGGDISITIVESKDAKATAREVAREIIAMQKNERRRM